MIAYIKDPIIFMLTMHVCYVVCVCVYIILYVCVCERLLHGVNMKNAALF